MTVKQFKACNYIDKSQPNTRMTLIASLAPCFVFKSLSQYTSGGGGVRILSPVEIHRTFYTEVDSGLGYDEGEKEDEEELSK